MAEMDGATGNVIREYIWLGALPIGTVDRLGSSGASRLFFIHADHLGRPQKITDSSRATQWDGVFAPFGEIHSITGSIVNVLMFPGQVYDAETGLAQNWHRDYDANIGRYLESDPIGLEGGFNTYAYVGGNPTGASDATGNQPARSEPAEPETTTRGGYSYSWNGGYWGALFGPQIAQLNRQLEEYGRPEWRLTYVGSPNLRQVDMLRISVDIARFEYQARQAEQQQACTRQFPRMTPDQEALKDLVNETTSYGRRPLSREEAETVVDWARETNYPGWRANPSDLEGSHWRGGPHIHLPGATRSGHVPVRPR